MFNNKPAKCIFKVDKMRLSEGYIHIANSKIVFKLQNL